MIARKIVFKNVADKHWIWAQKDNPVLCHIQEWLTKPKGDKQTLLGYLNRRVPDADHLAYAHWQKDLVLKRELMYMGMNTPSTKDRILTFLVPANKCHAALNSCHHKAEHQGKDRTFSLLKERFWWPGMGVLATLSIKNCERCHWYKAPEVYQRWWWSVVPNPWTWCIWICRDGDYIGNEKMTHSKDSVGPSWQFHMIHPRLHCRGLSSYHGC